MKFFKRKLFLLTVHTGLHRILGRKKTNAQKSKISFQHLLCTVCKKIIWTPFDRFAGTKISERRKNIFLTLIILFDRPKSLVYFTRKKFLLIRFAKILKDFQ